ncbi:hypothetical protein BJ912DRAFT_313011 [Pholiota molesta]|nr:hypothetical protein BJ912DRAFT_313011 [Pholiota molesta]
MYFIRLIVVTLGFMLSLVSTVLSSPVVATSPVEIVSDTSPHIRREESLEILVAKEYYNTTMAWDVTSATSATISGSASMASSTQATSDGLETLNMNSWLVNAMVGGGIIISLL